MAARSVAARKAAQADRAANPASAPLPAQPTADGEYVNTRLTRVRGQLELVDEAIDSELRKRCPDAQRLDRFAAASMRLSDQEFALAGRPKPGNRRPAPERKRLAWAEPSLASGTAFWPAGESVSASPCGSDSATTNGLPPGCEPGTPQPVIAEPTWLKPGQRTMSAS
jgi:hypothetical protein